MAFKLPMLAQPLKPRTAIRPGEWVAEEKLDGHRLIVSVGDHVSDLFGERSVQAWSRNEKLRALPAHVRKALQSLPNGTYDGELHVPGERSWGVTELVQAHKLVYTIFDVLEFKDHDCTSASYVERRMLLEVVFQQYLLDEIFQKLATDGPPVRLIKTTDIDSVEESKTLCASVWEAGGEGLILKRKAGRYTVGKRPSNEWIKLKDCKTASLVLIGFQSGLMGDRSIAVLRDDEGFETTVKWKNYEWLDEMEARGPQYVGRRARIEYQERTPDGSYRHPRWDRWEDE